MIERAHSFHVELPGAARNYFQEVCAMQIPKDVQEGIREIYGEDELLRRIAEVDQLGAKLRDDIEADSAEIESLQPMWHGSCRRSLQTSGRSRWDR
jgi:hypothetical protein